MRRHTLATGPAVSRPSAQQSAEEGPPEERPAASRPSALQSAEEQLNASAPPEQHPLEPPGPPEQHTLEPPEPPEQHTLEPPGPPEQHPFEPFLPSGARMLFLGSFPPPPHRWSMPFYYPNWINDFWRIIGLIHFGDREHFCLPAEKRFNEALIREFCANAGLAFYDTAFEVKRLRDNASDAFLEIVTPTDIHALLQHIPTCHTLVTTGHKATSVVAEYFGSPLPNVGEYVEIAGIRFWRMPSTSRAYPLPLERKADFYRRLFV